MWITVLVNSEADDLNLYISLEKENLGYATETTHMNWSETLF